MGAISKVINYRNISEGQKDIRRKDYWMMRFTRIPSGLAWPGQDLLDIRLKSFNPGIEDNPEIFNTTIRGTKILQAGPPNEVSGTASLSFQDRIDQQISYLIDQWKQLGGARLQKSGLPKGYYTSEIVFTLYDMLENPMRKLTLMNCTVPTGELDEEGEEEAGIEGALSMSIQYEAFERKFWINGKWV